MCISPGFAQNYIFLHIKIYLYASQKIHGYFILSSKSNFGRLCRAINHRYLAGKYSDNVESLLNHTRFIRHLAYPWKIF